LSGSGKSRQAARAGSRLRGAPWPRGLAPLPKWGGRLLAPVSGKLECRAGDHRKEPGGAVRDHDARQEPRNRGLGGARGGAL